MDIYVPPYTNNAKKQTLLVHPFIPIIILPILYKQKQFYHDFYYRCITCVFIYTNTTHNQLLIHKKSFNNKNAIIIIIIFVIIVIK